MQPENSIEAQPVKFNFFSLSFTPLKAYDGSKNNRNIAKDVITFLQRESKLGNGILVDKHEGRTKEAARPIFVLGLVFIEGLNRVRGETALLRKGRQPYFKPKEKFVLLPINSEMEIAERTHFFIDISSDEVVLCIEYNDEGPRASDLEFYFRIVAHDKLKLAKATSLEPFFDVPIDKALNNFKNILNFELKFQPLKVSQIDEHVRKHYLSGMTSFGNLVNPKYLKVEASFHHNSKDYKSTAINSQANQMIQRLLSMFKTKPASIDAFDNFRIKYEDSDGAEHFFNLIKGKKEIVKLVNFNEVKGSGWYELIKDDFTEFVETLK